MCLLGDCDLEKNRAKTFSSPLLHFIIGVITFRLRRFDHSLGIESELCSTSDSEVNCSHIQGAVCPRRWLRHVPVVHVKPG